MKNVDLAKLIQDEIEKSLSPEVLKERIADGVEKLIAKIMDEEVFGNWGVVKKVATDFIKENMKVDLSSTNLLPMCDAIKNEFQHHITKWDNDVRAKAVEDMADVLLGKAPEQIKLSEIIDMVKDTLESDEAQEIELNDDIDSIVRGFSIEWKDEYNNEQTLNFCIFDSLGDKQIHSVRFNGESLKNCIKEREVSGWLGKLLACERHNVPYIHDINYCDTYYSGEEE